MGSGQGWFYIAGYLKSLSVIQWALIVAGGISALLLLRLWLRCQAEYHIGRSSFRIRIFGLTVRRILYSDVERISKFRRHYKWSRCENWTNTLAASRRELVIHRKSGLYRKLVITPVHRYEFRAQFRAAVAAATGTELAAEADGDSEGETVQAETI